MMMENEITTVKNSNEKNLVDVEIARAVAQIQGSMAIAKKFPRDENVAIEKIRAAASRRILAEQAEYEYSRGGSKVSGPSIRAAEAVAQSWGNMDTGVVELRRDTDAGESLAMAYAVDLESNYWKHVTFSVPHTRDKTSGSVALTSSRDIYERVMNDGSRRLRNCILAVVPGDVMDLFMDECNKTLAKNAGSVQERIPTMLAALEEFEVTRSMIELKFGCKAEALSDRQLAQLRRIYQSLKDGFGMISDHFGAAAGSSQERTVNRVKGARSKDDAQKAKEQTQAPAQEPKQGDFAGFNAPPPKQTRSRDELIEAIIHLGNSLGKAPEQTAAMAFDQFKKPADKLSIDELEIFHARLAQGGMNQ